MQAGSLRGAEICVYAAYLWGRQLEVNGFLRDIRHAPRELQEAAFAKGLIPYIPADRAEVGEESSEE
jgi:hypothetical protein